MPSYTWTFEISFLVFLIIIFASQTISAVLKSIVPMPLIMGTAFIAGFAMGFLPRDMILSSNMIQVGTIAFNVLVIHSGTMINIFFIKKQNKNAAICLVSSLVMTLVIIFGLSPIIGRDLALLAPGSIVGGGASCAIASRWVLDKNPAVSVFPWMIFMFQGLFSVPILTWAMKKEAKLVLADLKDGKITPPQPPKEKEFGIVSKIPPNFKNTAYYLMIIMAVGVFNKFIHATILAPFNLNINMTALIFGFILGQFGFMDKSPLYKSDSYGLLLLGLMGLMANTMANNQLGNILRLLPPLLIAMAVGVLVLAGVGTLMAKKFGMSIYRGIILAVNSVTGFPVNGMLVKNAASIGTNDMEKGALTGILSPLLGMGTMLVSNCLSIFLVSILVNLV